MNFFFVTKYISKFKLNPAIIAILLHKCDILLLRELMNKLQIIRKIKSYDFKIPYTVFMR